MSELVNGIKRRLLAIYSYVRQWLSVPTVTGPDSSQGLMKYHATDKHDTLPSHFKLTLDQPVLL